MATSIPPHNLCEVVDAMKAYMQNENITTRELLHYVKGWISLQAALVCNKDELLDISMRQALVRSSFAV